MISRVYVQRDDSFLRLALEVRQKGETRRNVWLSSATCLSYCSLANLGTIMVFDHDRSWLSGKGHIDPFHLHRTNKLPRILWRGDGHTICCHVCQLPDATVGVEFQTTERELDRRTPADGFLTRMRAFASCMPPPLITVVGVLGSHPRTYSAKF